MVRVGTDASAVHLPSAAAQQQHRERPWRDNARELIQELGLPPESPNSVAIEHSTLGSGANGSVFLARDRLTGRLLAVKCALARSDSKDSLRRALREVAVMYHTRHPNVCGLHSFWLQPSPAHCDRLEVYIVMPRFAGRSLDASFAGRRDWLRSCPLRNRMLAHIARQLLAGLSALSAGKYLHRDLKPENVLVDIDLSRAANFDEAFLQTIFSLGDFGWARSQSELTMTAHFGTPLYIAPEILDRRYRVNRRYTIAVDVWSLGVLLHTLAVGRHPFDIRVPRDAVSSLPYVRNAHLKFDPATMAAVLRAEPGLDAQFVDLLTMMLQLDPARRASLAALQQHAFLADPDAAVRTVSFASAASGLAARSSASSATARMVSASIVHVTSAAAPAPPRAAAPAAQPAAASIGSLLPPPPSDTSASPTADDVVFDSVQRVPQADRERLATAQVRDLFEHPQVTLSSELHRSSNVIAPRFSSTRDDTDATAAAAVISLSGTISLSSAPRAPVAEPAADAAPVADAAPNGPSADAAPNGPSADAAPDEPPAPRAELEPDAQVALDIAAQAHAVHCLAYHVDAAGAQPAVTFALIERAVQLSFNGLRELSRRNASMTLPASMSPPTALTPTAANAERTPFSAVLAAGAHRKALFAADAPAAAAAAVAAAAATAAAPGPAACSDDAAVVRNVACPELDASLLPPKSAHIDSADSLGAAALSLRRVFHASLAALRSLRARCGDSEECVSTLPLCFRVCRSLASLVLRMRIESPGAADAGAARESMTRLLTACAVLADSFDLNAATDACCARIDSFREHLRETLRCHLANSRAARLEISPDVFAPLLSELRHMLWA